MARYRDRRGLMILPLVMAALLVSLAECGSARAGSGLGDGTTHTPRSSIRTPEAGGKSPR
jgi:hypothetical protein